MRINGSNPFLTIPQQEGTKIESPKELFTDHESELLAGKPETETQGFYDLDIAVEERPDPIGFCSMSNTCMSCSCTCSCATCGKSCPWC